MNNRFKTLSGFLALFLVLAVLSTATFTGCGRDDANNHADEKASAKLAASGEMTVILPDNVKLELVKGRGGHVRDEREGQSDRR